VLSGIANSAQLLKIKTFTKVSLYGYFRHIKTNRNDKHNYFYNFYSKDGKYYVDINISGTSYLKQIIELKRPQIINIP
jgi:hypothetical protein